MTDLPTSNECVSPHAGWLRKVAEEALTLKKYGWANTCERAADEIDALVGRLYPDGVDQIERLHTDLVGAREFHAAAGETVARMTADNERLRGELDAANQHVKVLQQQRGGHETATPPKADEITAWECSNCSALRRLSDAHCDCGWTRERSLLQFRAAPKAPARQLTQTERDAMRRAADLCQTVLDEGLLGEKDSEPPIKGDPEVGRLLVEAVTDLCFDCPSVGYPTDETRCARCPRRAVNGPASQA